MTLLHFSKNRSDIQTIQRKAKSPCFEMDYNTRSTIESLHKDRNCNEVNRPFFHTEMLVFN